MESAAKLIEAASVVLRAGGAGVFVDNSGVAMATSLPMKTGCVIECT